MATSDDVPGLVTEAPSFQSLVAKLEMLIPELLEANNVLPRRNLSGGFGSRNIPVSLLYDHHQRELSVHYY